MNNIDKLAKALVDSTEIKEKKKTSPYYTSAKVVKVEGDTAWVSIEGGVEQTPARMVVNARAGEDVRVHVAGGNAYVTGNATSPPTDDSYAKRAEAQALRATKAADRAVSEAETAHRAADGAVKDASIAHVAATNASKDAETAKQSADQAVADAARAQTSAESAQADADIAKASARDANEYATRALSGLSTVQSVAETLTWITQHGTMTLTTDTEIDPSHVYFVRDNDGDYVVGNVHYSLVIEPDVADISTYYELTIDESLNNYVGTHLALTGEGLWLLPASSGTSKVLIATGAGTSYTTAGTYIINSAGNVEASFRSDGAQVGLSTSGHTTIQPSGMKVYANDGTVELANIGYGSGNNQSGGKSNAPYYTFGRRQSESAVGNYSVAEGKDTTASGAGSHAEGASYVGITASGLGSHAEGYSGYYTITASGVGSHAEGAANYGNTEASGEGSHAEGSCTTAIGFASHAEGNHTIAEGNNSHAEGNDTHAKGTASHASGLGTIAEGNWQTVIGCYNIADTTSAFIIGNGGINNRRNAFIVDKNGDVFISLNTPAQSGTTDYDLYQAITALGWQNDVIV